MLPRELTTVTPLSRILAAITFICLPFISFFIGLQYGQSNIYVTADTSPTTIICSQEAVAPTGEPTHAPLASASSGQDTSAPFISGIYGIADNSVVSTAKACIHVTAYDETPHDVLQVRARLNIDAWSGWMPYENPVCFDSLKDGKYTLSVQAKDYAGNLSGISNRHFIVQITTP